MTTHPASGTRAAEVQLRNVSKRYGNVTAVKPLDLTIPAGSLVTLLGPSGCGKTTLLRMIAGLERVSDGRDPDRRSGCDAALRRRAQRVDGVPVLCAVSAYERAGKRRLWIDIRRREQEGCARESRRHPRTRRPEGVWSAPAVGDVRAASSSGSRWRAHSSSSLTSCCSTSRSPTSMPACGVRCARRFARFSRISASPSCTSPTISPRRLRSPTSSW